MLTLLGSRGEVVHDSLERDGWVDASPWHVSASVCFLCLIHFGRGLSQNPVVEDLTNEIMDSLRTLGRNYS